MHRRAMTEEFTNVEFAEFVARRVRTSAMVVERVEKRLDESIYNAVTVLVARKLPLIQKIGEERNKRPMRQIERAETRERQLNKFDFDCSIDGAEAE